MKSKTIEQGNFLIARFLGYTYPNTNTRSWKLSQRDLHNYRENWNLLMPVYLKIASEELYGEDGEGISIFNVLYERLGDGDGIEEVWEWIVKFIQWYTSQTAASATEATPETKTNQP